MATVQLENVNKVYDRLRRNEQRGSFGVVDPCSDGPRGWVDLCDINI